LAAIRGGPASWPGAGREVAGEVGFAYALGLAERTLGRIARAQGESGLAATRLGTALDVFAGIGARFEAARTTADLVSLAGARGDRPEAARLARQAEALLRGLGAPAREREVEQRLRAPAVEPAVGSGPGPVLPDPGASPDSPGPPRLPG
jgi:hypothetical protein